METQDKGRAGCTILVIRFRGRFGPPAFHLSYLLDDGTETHFEDLEFLPLPPRPTGLLSWLYRRKPRSEPGLQDTFSSLIVDRIRQGTRTVIIDLSELRWINSTGLGHVVTCYGRAKEAGARLVVVGLSDRARQVFQIAKLDTVLTIMDTVQQVLEHLASSEEKRT